MNYTQIIYLQYSSAISVFGICTLGFRKQLDFGKMIDTEFKVDRSIFLFFAVERVHTYLAAPGALGGDLHRRVQAVHVVSPVTVVTEQQLVIILRGAAQAAGLTLDALPGILPHADLHVGRKLQTARMTCNWNIRVRAILRALP